METFIYFLSFVLIVLTLWGGFIAYNTYKIIKFVKKQLNRPPRRADIVTAGVAILISAAAGFILFVYPGLMWKIPSTLVVLEMATAVMLTYMTELQMKHANRLHEIVYHRQDVDDVE